MLKHIIWHNSQGLKQSNGKQKKKTNLIERKGRGRRSKGKVLADITNQWVRLRMLLKVGFTHIAVSITIFMSSMSWGFQV
jgi:hypothetical protein